MAGKPLPFPKKEQALKDWLLAKRDNWDKAKIVEHFHKHYGKRFKGRQYEAIRFAMSRVVIEAKVDKALPEIPEPNRTYFEDIPELVIEANRRVIVISDAHMTQHSPQLIARLLNVIDARDIEVVVFNGDTFDNAYLGHKGIRNARAATAAENLHSAAALVNAVLRRPSVKRIVVIQGNHDDKPLRATDSEITFDAWWMAMVYPLLDKHDKQLEVTHRYYVTMEPLEPQPWPFKSRTRAFPIRFTHQKEYARNPLSVAIRLADRLLMNVVTGHQHHLTVGDHKSGLLFVADAGTLQDPQLAEYKVNRDTTHPEWTPGFLTIEDWEPIKWKLNASDEWWAERLAS